MNTPTQELPTFSREAVMGIVRHGLTIAGGWLVSQGWLSASQTEQLTGIALAILGIAWSLVRKWRRSRAAAPAGPARGLLMLLATLLSLMVGCASITPDQLTRVETLTRNAIQTGATAALVARPQSRPILEGVLTNVEASVANGRITATALVGFVKALPIDANTLRIVNGVAIVWDAASAFWLNPATDAALLASARGVADGLRTALKLAALPATRGSPPVPAAAVTRSTTPQPTAQNTKKI